MLFNDTIIDPPPPPPGGGRGIDKQTNEFFQLLSIAVTSVKEITPIISNQWRTKICYKKKGFPIEDFEIIPSPTPRRWGWGVNYGVIEKHLIKISNNVYFYFSDLM